MLGPKELAGGSSTEDCCMLHLWQPAGKLPITRKIPALNLTWTCTRLLATRVEGSGGNINIGILYRTKQKSYYSNNVQRRAICSASHIKWRRYVVE